MGLSNIMTPCRTEEVDFSKKNKIKNKNIITKKTNRQEESPEETNKKQEKKLKKNKNKNNNRITKKTNRQEESPEETNKKQEKKQKKSKPAFSAVFVFFCVFFFCFFSCLFLGFGVLVFFVCPGFVFVLFFDFFLIKPYILCVIGLIRLKIGYPKTHGLKPHFPYHKLPFLVVKIT